MVDETQIQSKINILTEAVKSKIGVLNDPNYPSTFQEASLMRERIEEMKHKIEALKWVLNSKYGI